LTKICPSCHFDNPDGINFCVNCGTSLTPPEENSTGQTATLETPFSELEKGTTFAGRYEIIEELGQGGMGKVYRVKDKTVGEEVALKIIRPGIPVSAKVVERFRNELKLARKIKHKNVCQMFDLGEVAGTYFITMEYIPGENLKRYIKRTKRLEIGSAVSLAIQICEGMAAAHQLGVIHRDLKSSNIMIDNKGEVRIMDFGIARSLESKQITREGRTMGTPQYMSPEQVGGEGLDQRSDIYSFGIILYEMLTGRVPFEGDDSFALGYKHINDPPPHPHDLNPEIPNHLCHILEKCLEKNKEDRYQNAEEVSLDLIKIGRKHPASEKIIPKIKPKPRLNSKRRPHQALFWLAAISLVLMVILGYILLNRTQPSNRMDWKNSIAVLPFEDRSPLGDQEALCDEMTMTLITNLSSCKDLKVSPYRSIRNLWEEGKSLKEIGQGLDAETILVSYLKVEDEKIAITAQLVNASQNFVIDNFNYEKTRNRFSELRLEFVKDVAAKLGVIFTPEKEKAMAKREPENPEALQYYSKGKYFERKYLDSLDEINPEAEEENFKESVKNYEKAIDIENDFAMAYLSLGDVYHNRFIYAEKDFIYFSNMEKNYDTAYQIDPDLAEANVGLGWAHFYKEEWEEAFKFYKRALDLDPTNPKINYHVASFFNDIGLYNNALEFYLRAIEIDPVSQKYREYCARCFMKLGKYEEAAEILRPALKQVPDDSNIQLLHARQLIMMEKFDEAEKVIAGVEKKNQDLPDIQYTRAYIYAFHGEKEKALTIIQDLDPYIYTSLISPVYSLLGMKDKAIENIQNVIKFGLGQIKTFPYTYLALSENNFYDGLRDDPRFQEIIKEEKNKYQERLKKYSDI